MSSKPHTFRKSRGANYTLRFVCVAAAIALASVVAEAAHGATLVKHDGTHGAVYMTEPGAQCYLPLGPAGQSFRVLIVRPPTKVYAVNRTLARDWNWIRFRTHVVNKNTGVELMAKPWSGWSLAYDDAPATWSGTQQAIIQETDWMDYNQIVGSFVAQVEIEWWTGTNRVGGVTGQVYYYEQLAAAINSAYWAELEEEGYPSGPTINYGSGLGC